MDNFQKRLRLLIVTGSAVGFLGGWGLLARTGNSATGDATANADPGTDSTTPVIVPTLPPLDFKAIEGGSTPNTNQQFAPNIQSVPNTQSVPTFRPRFRTRTS